MHPFLKLDIMNQEERDKVAEFFQPLIDEFGDELKSVILTGSAVRNERVEGSDIDLLVLMDDHVEEFDKKDLKKAKKMLKQVQDRAQEEGYDLHIQPPKPISNWYSLLLKGRPWAITSMIYSQPIYDPDKFQETTQKMIRNSEPKSTNRRADKLEKEVGEHFEKADEKLRKGFQTIIENVNLSAKSLVKYREGKVVSDDELVRKLDELFEEELDTEKYRELTEKERKIENNHEEPSFTELEQFSEKAVELIKQLEENFETELGEFRKELVDQTLKEIEESCKVLLEEKDIEYEEDEVFERFKEGVIQKGVLSQDYWKLIQETRSLKEEELEDIDEKSIYHPIIGLREFESAVNNIIEKDLFESFELHSESDTAQITPINEYEEKMLEKFDSIRGVYIVSQEHLLETDSVTVVLLIEDDGEEEKIREYARKVENEIGEEHGFNIHTETEKLIEYWSELQNGDEELIYEVKSCIVSYDANGLLESTQKLVDKGKLPDTIPRIRATMKKTTLQSVMPVKKVKKESLKEYYNGVIKLGQSKLLRKGITPPVQKKVPETLEQELLETADTTQEEIDIIQETISLFKAREYGKEDQIPAEKLDEIRKQF